VDDHQERYARRLNALPGYIVVTDMLQLAAAIEEARAVRGVVYQPDVSTAVAVFEELIGCS